MPENETIEEARVRKGCTCPPFKNLSWIELRDLGSGCAKVGVCPVLDRYRRSVHPTAEERAAEDVRLAKEMAALWDEPPKGWPGTGGV